MGGAIPCSALRGESARPQGGPPGWDCRQGSGGIPGDHLADRPGSEGATAGIYASFAGIGPAGVGGKQGACPAPLARPLRVQGEESGLFKSSK